jgi:cysteine-rich repeat protein
MMVPVRVYAAVVAIWLCGCVEDHLVHCANDLVCPQNSRCDDVHGSCATPDQFTACDGLVDGDTCTANQLSGFCDQGVCIKPGCGNHVTEANEVCDDGNTTSGDGCSADCTSLESCGNGVLDVVHGETCDDGNLMSRDGCDSQCKIEPLGYGVIGIEPTLGTPGWGTYDAGHHEVVHFADGILWAFAGDHWEVRSTTGPANFAWYQVVYDPTRSRVVVVGPLADLLGNQSAAPLVISEWDGTTWSTRTTQSKAMVSATMSGTAVYETKAKALLVIAATAGKPIAWELADDWNDITPIQPIALGDGYSAAYDVANNAVVIAIYHASGTPDTVVRNGTGWIRYPATTLGNGSSGYTLGWNTKLGSVVAIGGNPASQTVSTWDPMMATWNMTAFILPAARKLPEVISNTAPFDALVFGGDNVGPHDDVYALNLSGFYGPVTVNVPPTGLTYQYAYDDVHDRLIAVGQQGAQATTTWQWDGTAWTMLATTPLPAAALSIAFDPARGVIVATTSTATYGLGDAGWIHIADQVGSVALTYDPDGRLFAIATTVRTLAPTGTTWLPVASATPPTADASAAFDARDHEIVLIDAVGGATYVLDTTSPSATWKPTVSPGPSGYHVVEDRRRGTVWFVGAGGPSWERVSGNWVMQPSLELAIDGPSLYAASGDLFTIGSVGTSRVMVKRRFANASPIESCVAGADDDGDGLVACDDPDCYATCGTCPPYASCP